MKLHKYIIVFFIFISTHFFAQTTFKNIDTLLSKTFHTVSLKDSSQYLAVLNQPAIYKDKKVKSKLDSLELMKSYTEAYRDLYESIEDMVGSQDFTINYNEYIVSNKKQIDATSKGRILLHVKLIVNDSFTVTVPFMLTAEKGIYTTETPLMAMFLEN
jgi:hypothetical protein